MQQMSGPNSSILSTQIRNELQRSCRPNEELITRREFADALLTSAAFKLAAVAESMTLTLPAVEVAAGEIYLRKAPEERKKQETAAAAQFHGKQTRFVFNFQNGARLMNIGVHHTEPALELDAAMLRQEIQRADIVLLECEDVGYGRHRHARRGYFHQLRVEALKQKKALYDIDVKNYTGLSGYIAAGAAVISALYLHPLDWFSRRLFERKMPLRGFVRGLGWSMAALCCGSVLSNNGSNPVGDFSFIRDGRTVIMLEKIVDLAKANPGKKLLVISGDNHANGFVFYLGHPRLFAAKSALYSALYRPWFTGPINKIESEPESKMAHKHL